MKRTGSFRLDQTGLQDNTELLNSCRADVTAGPLTGGNPPLHYFNLYLMQRQTRFSERWHHDWVTQTLNLSLSHWKCRLIAGKAVSISDPEQSVFTDEVWRDKGTWLMTALKLLVSSNSIPGFSWVKWNRTIKLLLEQIHAAAARRGRATPFY